jgi:hypothetical protein
MEPRKTDPLCAHASGPVAAKEPCRIALSKTRYDVNMSMYLGHDEVLRHRLELAREFEGLVSNPWFSTRKNSRQWQFLKHCFAVLMGEAVGDFECSKSQATQYKFEISERLNEFYLAFGQPVNHIFALISEKSSIETDGGLREYPTSNGYALRVSENTLDMETSRLRKHLLERTIADAIERELAVYRTLPEISLRLLDGVYDPDGEAYKKIALIAAGCQERGWSMRNNLNPSTARLMNIKISRMTDTVAEVRTREYWLLQWFSVEQGKNVYRYKEENWQTYFLSWNNDHWLVVDNPYPPPKLSTPRRSIRSRSNK